MASSMSSIRSSRSNLYSTDCKAAIIWALARSSAVLLTYQDTPWLTYQGLTLVVATMAMATVLPLGISTTLMNLKMSRKMSPNSYSISSTLTKREISHKRTLLQGLLLTICISLPWCSKVQPQWVWPHLLSSAKLWVEVALALLPFST